MQFQLFSLFYQRCLFQILGQVDPVVFLPIESIGSPSAPRFDSETGWSQIPGSSRNRLSGPGQALSLDANQLGLVSIVQFLIGETRDAKGKLGRRREWNKGLVGFCEVLVFREKREHERGRSDWEGCMSRNGRVERREKNRR